MKGVLQQLLATLLLAGMWGVATYAQTTGPKIIKRDLTSPSIHEGLSGEKSAGVKTNIDPAIGQVTASYDPFKSLLGAMGSLVQPFSVRSPTPSDPSTVGTKYTSSRLFFSPTDTYFTTNRTDRLFPGTKELGGENITDEAKLGTPGGKKPGDPYWVAYPRPGNVERSPRYQLVHHPYDCFCRWDEMVNCPLQSSPFWHVNFGAPFFPPHFTPVTCQRCFGVDRIRKHDFYVGKSKSGAFDGYPFSYPTDTGYQECLRQSVDSFATSGSGGPVQGGRNLYGL